MLPHRFPFQLIEVPPSCSEKWRTLEAHLTDPAAVIRGQSPYPPILTIEMLAQAALVGLGEAGDPGAVADGETGVRDRPARGALAGLDRVHFADALVAAPLSPGDVLQIQIEIVARFGRLLKTRGTLERRGQLLVEAELMLAADP